MKLLTVDIEYPLPDIPPPTVGEQWVLVRLHGAPLGILVVPEGPGWTAADLAGRIVSNFAERILRHLVRDGIAGGQMPVRLVDGVPALAQLPRECAGVSNPELPILSIAVCTRNGSARLGPCLDSLAALRYPPERLDLIVVDNAPADASTRDVVLSGYLAFRYIVEPRPGLDWARNRAILEARGEVIAFTDDDVTVDEGWALAIGRLFAGDPDVQAVTGLVVPDEIDAEPQRLFEQYGGFNRGYDRQYFRVGPGVPRDVARLYGGTGRFGTGANMAFRRSFLDRIGLFDPALDVGTPTNGGGDLEMFFRVLKEGGTLVYEPAAIVRHRHRKNYDELRTQIANNGIGFYSYLVRSAGAYPDERVGLVRLGVWWLWWWNVRRLARSYVHPRWFPRELVLAELKGSLMGVRRYERSREHAARLARAFGPQQPAPAGAHGEPA